MKRIFPYLTYAGAAPFIFFAVCLSADIPELPLLGSVEKILSAYGLVISSFLTGIHWGQHLHINQGKWNFSLPLLSNMITVLLWLSFLALSFKILMGVFVAAFVIILIIDYRLFQIKLITHHYFQTRFFVSTIVIISLIISGALS